MKNVWPLEFSQLMLNLQQLINKTTRCGTCSRQYMMPLSVFKSLLLLLLNIIGRCSFPLKPSSTTRQSTISQLEKEGGKQNCWPLTDLPSISSPSLYCHFWQRVGQLQFPHIPQKVPTLPLLLSLSICSTYSCQKLRYMWGGEKNPYGGYLYVFWHPRASEKELTGRNLCNTGVMEALSGSFWCEQGGRFLVTSHGSILGYWKPSWFRRKFIIQ